jgi:energy-coupling factor transport system substrate-specific component
MLAAIPAVIFLGSTIFKDRQYAFVTFAVVFLACVPFYLSFERRKDNGKLMIIIAVMVALSSVGRFVFAAVPGFKPVTALVILTALYFGGEAGFVTGSLTAVISNFYFGQGPWTPFQMFAWGLIGLFAGLLAKKLLKSRILLIIYGVFAGAFYSLLMDIWSVLWWDGAFNYARFIAAVVTALPATAMYSVSNAVFLCIFIRPVGGILNRIKRKYGV